MIAQKQSDSRDTTFLSYKKTLIQQLQTKPQASRAKKCISLNPHRHTQKSKTKPTVVKELNVTAEILE